MIHLRELLTTKKKRQMINNAILIGNVGSDPEVTTFDNGGKIARISLATTKNWKDKESGEKKEKTTWHNVQFGGPLVNVVEQYVKKGDKLYIGGSIDNYSYQDKDGNTKWASRILCDTMKMLTSKSQQGEFTPPVPSNSTDIPTTSESNDDDDLPF